MEVQLSLCRSFNNGFLSLITRGSCLVWMRERFHLELWAFSSKGRDAVHSFSSELWVSWKVSWFKPLSMSDDEQFGRFCFDGSKTSMECGPAPSTLSLLPRHIIRQSTYQLWIGSTARKRMLCIQVLILLKSLSKVASRSLCPSPTFAEQPASCDTWTVIFSTFFVDTHSVPRNC